MPPASSRRVATQVHFGEALAEGRLRALRRRGVRECRPPRAPRTGRANQGAQARRVDVDFAIGTARCACGRRLTGDVAGAFQVFQVAPHGARRDAAHHVQLVDPLQDARRIERLGRLAQRAHDQVTDDLVAVPRSSTMARGTSRARGTMHVHERPVQRPRGCAARPAPGFCAVGEGGCARCGACAGSSGERVEGAPLRGGVAAARSASSKWSGHSSAMPCACQYECALRGAAESDASDGFELRRPTVPSRRLPLTALISATLIRAISRAGRTA